MWDKVKAPFVWIANKFHEFEVWFASKVPWLRSKGIALLGAIGSAAASMQEYITNVPLAQIMTAERLAWITFGLMTVIYLVRRLGTLGQS